MRLSGAYPGQLSRLKERFNQSYDSLSNILGQLICLPDLVNDLYVLEKSRAYVIDSPYLDTAEKTLGAVLKRIIGGDDYAQRTAVRFPRCLPRWKENRSITGSSI